MDLSGGEFDGERDPNIARFFIARYELTIAFWRGMIDVVVVEIDGMSIELGGDDDGCPVKIFLSLLMFKYGLFNELNLFSWLCNLFIL